MRKADEEGEQIRETKEFVEGVRCEPTIEGRKR